MRIPREVGVMVLTDAVLFPGAMMPLHLFEPRYRRMLADALAEHRMFAVGLAKSPNTPHPVVTVGLIRSAVKRPDGTSDVMLQGIERVRILEFAAKCPGKGYPVASVDVLNSYGTTSATARRPVLTLVRKLSRTRARRGDPLPKPLIQSMAELEDGGLLADVIGHILIESPRQKQRLLQELDVRHRLMLVTALLKQQLEREQMWKTLQGDLPNEHVGFN